MAIVREEEHARGETPRRWRRDRRAALLGTAVTLAEVNGGIEACQNPVEGMR